MKSNADVLRALADGKVLRMINMPIRVRLHPELGLQESRNASLWQGTSLTFVGDGSTWEEYLEPNPHQPGTYAWARVEFMRGRDVRWGQDIFNHAATHDWTQFRFSHEQIISTRWCHE